MTQNTTQAHPPSPKPASQRNNRPFFRRIPLSNLQIVLIALAVVGGRLIFDFTQRILEGQAKVKEQRNLEAEIATLTHDQQELEADKAYHSSPAYVESWAHDQGKMVRDGEVLVIPTYDKNAQTGATVTSSEPVRSLPTWHVWWYLFFDDPPPFSSSTDSLTENGP